MAGTSFPPAALSKAYEHHVGKALHSAALPTCSYTKNILLTALVICKLGWSVVPMIVFCAAAGQRHVIDN